MRRVLTVALVLCVALPALGLSIEPDLGAPEVQLFIDSYLTKDREWVERSFQRLSFYRSIVIRALRERGLPEELVVLPVLESGYRGDARSTSGAKGYWQFMLQTARRFGLGVSRWVDERGDIEKSSKAAARYLSYLYSIFKDWNLVLAAYNSGEGNILRIMKTTGIKDYWLMCRLGLLSRQAREFVPRFMALLWIYRHREELGLKVDGNVRLAKVHLPGGVSLLHVARASGMDYNLIRELNPFLRRGITPPWGARIYVPEQLVAKVRSGIVRLALAEKARRARIRLVKGYWKGYVVKRGDTLWDISRRTGIPVELIRMVNGLWNNVIRPGDVLLVPTKSLMRRIVKVDYERGVLVYRVGRGDTIWKISRLFGVSARRIKGSHRLKPGDRLRIVLAGYTHENG